MKILRASLVIGLLCLAGCVQEGVQATPANEQTCRDVGSLLRTVEVPMDPPASSVDAQVAARDLRAAIAGLDALVVDDELLAAGVRQLRTAHARLNDSTPEQWTEHVEAVERARAAFTRACIDAGAPDALDP